MNTFGVGGGRRRGGAVNAISGGLHLIHVAVEALVTCAVSVYPFLVISGGESDRDLTLDGVTLVIYCGVLL